MNASATPPAELHLPDLPEVAVQLGGHGEADPDAGRRGVGQPWHWHVRQAVSSYLPLLLMAMLAAGTWWLVKHTPEPPGPPIQRAERQLPDYTMSGFSVTRFAADGKVMLRIDGAQLRHYPATDRMEVDDVHIHAIGNDGRITEARARRAVVNGDATEVQLIGGAEVVSRTQGSRRLEIRSDFLHGFLRFERVRTHLPVQLTHGPDSMRAGGLDYDHLQGRLMLMGPVKLRLDPAAPKSKPTGPAP
jgi:lipopolysaccharide export system protein LptC